MAGPLDRQAAQNIMESVDFSTSEQLLQEDMPRLIPGPLGRVRLVESLANRFGANFRAQTAPRAALDEFDQQTKQVEQILRLRGLLTDG